MHDMETIHGLCSLPTAFGNLFSNMSEAPETAFAVNLHL